MTLSSCYYDKEEDLYPSRFVCDENKTVSFSGDLVPILEKNCWVCHSSANAASLASGIIIETPNQITSRSSQLLKNIKHEPGASNMPKNGNKLSDCEIATFENWINQGGNDN